MTNFNLQVFNIKIVLINRMKPFNELFTRLSIWFFLTGLSLFYPAYRSYKIH